MEGTARRKRKAKVVQQECVACGCCVKVCPLSAIHIHQGIYAFVNESKCVGCGKCARACPVGAIYPDAPKKTDSSLCIGCTRCVRVCPKGARKLSAVKLLAGKCMLAKAQKTPKEPELFL